MLARSLHTFALAAASFAAAPAAAAPITFNTALPVSKGEAIVREQLVLTRASGAGAEVTDIAAVSMLGYGVTSKLAAFAAAPLMWRSAKNGGAEREDFGLGDATPFARYELFRSDALARTLRLAVFAGVTLPTGEEGETGDGSTDVLAGLVLTAASTQWVFDAQAQYVANSEANGFERGDAASLDASVQRRIGPPMRMQEGQGYLFAVLEANATRLGRDRMGGVENPDSGGTLVFLSPGLQFAAPRWIAEAAVRLPLAANLNGAQIEPDYSVIASLRVNF